MSVQILRNRETDVGSWTSVVYREYSGARTSEKVIMGLSRWWFFFVFWCNLINPIYGRLFHLMNLCGSSDEVSNASRWGMLSIFWFVTVYHAVIYHLAGDKCLRVQLPSQKTTSNLIDNVNKGIFLSSGSKLSSTRTKKVVIAWF